MTIDAGYRCSARRWCSPIGFAIAIGLRRQPAVTAGIGCSPASIILAAAQPAMTRVLPSWTITPSWINSVDNVVPPAPAVSHDGLVRNHQRRNHDPNRRLAA